MYFVLSAFYHNLPSKLLLDGKYIIECKYVCNVLQIHTYKVAKVFLLAREQTTREEHSNKKYFYNMFFDFKTCSGPTFRNQIIHCIVCFLLPKLANFHLLEKELSRAREQATRELYGRKFSYIHQIFCLQNLLRFNFSESCHMKPANP